MKHRGVFSVVVAGLILVAGIAYSHEPPRNLHQVGDHWTAWDPPSTFDPGADVYVIVRGDTLWDLANKFYGDPYLWPQLWERNQYIQDAHWIYPGDPLVVGFEVTPLENLADLEDMAEEEEGDGLDRSIGAPQALGSESDLYCSGYIASTDREFPRRIVGSEYQSLGPTLTLERVKRRFGARRTDAPTAKVGLSTGDIVYLDGGEAAGMLPGSVYTAVEARDLVRHPVSDDEVGRFYGYLGQVRVLSVQETTAIAEISESCGPMLIGSFLEPFEPQPIPLRRRTPMRGVNDPVSKAALDEAPSIIYTQDDIVSLGQHSIVHIDRGEGAMTPGDLFTIYRLGPEGLPPMVLGELAVLSVHERSSVARILEARYTVYVGDLLDPK